MNVTTKCLFQTILTSGEKQWTIKRQDIFSPNILTQCSISLRFDGNDGTAKKNMRIALRKYLPFGQQIRDVAIIVEFTTANYRTMVELKVNNINYKPTLNVAEKKSEDVVLQQWIFGDQDTDLIAEWIYMKAIKLIEVLTSKCNTGETIC